MNKNNKAFFAAFLTLTLIFSRQANLYAQDTTSAKGNALPSNNISPAKAQLNINEQQQQNGSAVLNTDQEAVNNGQPAIVGIPLHKKTKRTKGTSGDSSLGKQPPQ